MATSLFEDVSNNLKNLCKNMISVPELRSSTKDMNEIVKNIKSPLLIMVMGEFSTGKSTFINALVGKSITKVDAKPTTAVITKLSYGTEDKITVFFRNGSHQGYDVDKFSELTAESNAESNRLHEEIDYVERALPIDILKYMSIIDSPGLNSIKSVHEETTRRFMDKADTVLWMFDASNGAGAQTEIEALKRLNPRLAPIVLVNKMDAIDEDEGDTPDGILSELEKRLSNNKLEFQKILGISAKQAFQGYAKGNEKLITASNIGAFYDVVDTIVLPNREKYKRNSMWDELSKVVFDIGNIVDEKKKQNNLLKETDYSAYIASEESLASITDELEELAEIFLSTVEPPQENRRRIKLNIAEKTFYSVMYFFGIAVERNLDMAQKYLEEAAVRNDMIAQRILAMVYQKMGQIEKAKYWFERVGVNVATVDLYQSAELGNTDAMNNLGLMYATGKDVPQDYAMAYKWFQRATEAGNVGAMYNLGVMYYDGYGVQRDYAMAYKCYQQAAEAGDIGAMYNLGFMYWHGQYVSQDYVMTKRWWLKASQGGHIKAMNLLGLLYALGEKGVKRDYTEANKWFYKAAMLGLAEAMENLGESYEQGRGVSINLEDAANWYQKSVDAGNKDEKIFDSLKRVKMQIAASVRDDGVTFGKESVKDESVRFKSNNYSENYVEEMERYQIRANQGDGSAMYYIGRMYEKGLGVSQNFATAMSWYRKAVENGYVNADMLFEIGEQYRYGRNVEQDYVESLKWYLKAADAGSRAAMFEIGECYYSGHGMPKDIERALQWYKKAQIAGHKWANVAIEKCKKAQSEDENAPQKLKEKKRREALCKGRLYEKGNMESPNYTEAIKWYQVAANLDDVEAMIAIGRMYEKGHGVSRNFATAVSWYRKAVENGYTDAGFLYELAEIYRRGQGVKQDYEESIKWYLKAADAGSRAAMYEIGESYFFGYGVEQDLDKAVYWYQKAEIAKHKLAKAALEKCKKIKSGVNIEELSSVTSEGEGSTSFRQSQPSKGYVTSKQEKKRACFITTAVCYSFNKPDDCYELTMFRFFRDHWLKRQRDGESLITLYYDIAPRIVKAIELREDAKEIYHNLWEKYLSSCLSYIELGDYVKCKEIYISMVINLQKKLRC